MQPETWKPPTDTGLDKRASEIDGARKLAGLNANQADEDLAALGRIGRMMRSGRTQRFVSW